MYLLSPVTRDGDPIHFFCFWPVATLHWMSGSAPKKWRVLSQIRLGQQHQLDSPMMQGVTWVRQEHDININSCDEDGCFSAIDSED